MKVSPVGAVTMTTIRLVSVVVTDEPTGLVAVIGAELEAI